MAGVDGDVAGLYALETLWAGIVDDLRPRQTCERDFKTLIADTNA